MSKEYKRLGIIFSFLMLVLIITTAYLGITYNKSLKNNELSEKELNTVEYTESFSSFEKVTDVFTEEEKLTEPEYSQEKEVSSSDLERFSKEYQEFLEDYNPSLKPVAIPDETLKKLLKDRDDVDWENVYLSYGNFIWWLEEVFPKLFENDFTAFVDAETKEIVVNYQDDVILALGKEDASKWIVNVANRSMFVEKHELTIRFTLKKE